MSLGPFHLDMFPVWTWNETRDGFVPVDVGDALPRHYELVVKATITLACGLQLAGSVFIDMGRCSAITVYIDDTHVTFGYRTPWKKGVQELAQKLKIPQTAIFPIKYETDHHYAEESNISGEFMIELT